MAALREELKCTASKYIDGCSEELYQQICEELWMNPELGFEEYKAHEILTGYLEKKGFSVERSYTGIETAFRAIFGSGRPNVCVICEYDALPEIGHACGHNLIAEAGVAAGLGLKAALESSNAPKGRLTVMGTPAEETLGGKINLVENGAFKDVDIAMMVHPAPYSILKTQFIACVEMKITYTGKAAHAAAFPWEGVNALDAAVMAYTSISVLRQQMKPDHSIHGVITNGGTKPNIIPEKASMEYFIRAPTRSEVYAFIKKVRACFEAAAIATGCQVDIEECSSNFDMKSNNTLAANYHENYQALGGCEMIEEWREIGSTDMGNVSYSVPSIHPMYKIGSGEVYHTRDFTTVTNTPEAHAETLVAAKAMAHTCIDVLTTDGLLERIRKEFESP
jgi:amidohydrolase